MKKIKSLLFILISLLSLTSCAVTSWEPFPNQLTGEVKLYKYDEELEQYQLRVRIILPEEVYQDTEDTVVVQIRLYLTVDCYDPETNEEQVYYDIPVDVLAPYAGMQEYYPYLDITPHQGQFSNKCISNVELNYAEFRVIARTGTELDNLPDGGMKVMKNIIYGMLFSFLVYIVLVVVLGIIVNKKITKQQTKARDEFYQSYFNKK